MSLPRNKNRKRRKLMSVSVAGAPLLGLLLSGCPDREVTLIDNSAGTESAGEPMVFSNPKGSMYDQGLAGELVVPDMVVSQWFSVTQRALCMMKGMMKD